MGIVFLASSRCQWDYVKCLHNKLLRLSLSPKWAQILKEAPNLAQGRPASSRCSRQSSFGACSFTSQSLLWAPVRVREELFGAPGKQGSPAPLQTLPPLSAGPPRTCQCPDTLAVTLGAPLPPCTLIRASLSCEGFPVPLAAGL